MENNILQVRVELEGDLLRKFRILKKYYGLENATEIVRMLISERYKTLFPKEDVGLFIEHKKEA